MNPLNEMLTFTSSHLKDLGFTSPSVIIFEETARVNIRTMISKAQRNGITFRPHFKTHQSADVGQWFADEGVTAISVSSVSMAVYFANHGWNDITIAFLLNPLELPQIEKLALDLSARSGQLAVTIDSPEAAVALNNYTGPELGVWVKVDTGYGRTGVPWQDGGRFESIAKQLPKQTRLLGLLTHNGESYQTSTTNDLNQVWTESTHRMQKALSFLPHCDHLSISLGDTPCCRFLDYLPGVNEIRPGNFVFFDLMMWTRGICNTEELAAAAVCPVVGLYPDKNKVVLHGGAVHLSREYLLGSGNKPIFGYLGVLSLNQSNKLIPKVLSDAPVVTLSQEHGTVELTPENYQKYIQDLKIGDLVLVWPVHSCLTCDLANEYRADTKAILTKK
ncbi:MAG: hypothetical protein GY780_05300 [bacterium]|nr:hypothetical protein [bacterium]